MKRRRGKRERKERERGWREEREKYLGRTCESKQRGTDRSHSLSPCPLASHCERKRERKGERRGER